MIGPEQESDTTYVQPKVALTALKDFYGFMAECSLNQKMQWVSEALDEVSQFSYWMDNPPGDRRARDFLMHFYRIIEDMAKDYIETLFAIADDESDEADDPEEYLKQHYEAIIKIAEAIEKLFLQKTFDGDCYRYEPDFSESIERYTDRDDLD